jgi:hypothetical protein
MGEIASFSLVWKGDQVNAQTRNAMRWGIDSTMADCVTTACDRVPVGTTSFLKGSLKMHPAVDNVDNITGYWGSFDIKYAPFVEFGTRPHWPPVDAIAKSMKVDRSTAFLIARAISRYGTRPHPYLIPAAEAHYPSLSHRIAAQIAWGGK